MPTRPIVPNFPPHVTSRPDSRQTVEKKRDSRACQDPVDDFLTCLEAGRIPAFMDLASANTKEFRREVLSACDADGGTREGGSLLESIAGQSDIDLNEASGEAGV
jgi:hypothetical protein